MDAGQDPISPEGEGGRTKGKDAMDKVGNRAVKERGEDRGQEE